MSWVFSFGVFSLASRAFSNIAAAPQRRPNSDSAAASAPAPFAATASRNGRSHMNRSTPSNGGDWLNMSWVSKRAWMDMMSLPERTFYHVTASPVDPCPAAPCPAGPTPPMGFALMKIATKTSFVLHRRHLLGIEGLSPEEITGLLDLAEEYVDLNRQIDKKRSSLRGRTIINLFFEASTRTQSSFELAGKRLGADVMNMSVANSSVKKGETLVDTAITLNAMRPDIIVVRHSQAGAAHLLARKVDCAVVNAGDGAHEHPTQALLDALTIRRNKGRLEGLTIAICGDVMHSRVARSNILLLNTMGARVRVVAPSTLLPRGIERMGVEVARDMREGLNGADIVMMLRLQRERMNGSFVPSSQEYFHYFGLDQKKLAYAKPDALVMHPGPMNRGVEIDSIVADGAQSLIREQVEMGVAVRMAVLEALARNLPNA